MHGLINRMGSTQGGEAAVAVIVVPWSHFRSGLLRLIESRCLFSESFKFSFPWTHFRLALLILCDISILKNPICLDVGVELWNPLVRKALREGTAERGCALAQIASKCIRRKLRLCIRRQACTCCQHLSSLPDLLAFLLIFLNFPVCSLNFKGFSLSLRISADPDYYYSC